MYRQTQGQETGYYCYRQDDFDYIYSMLSTGEVWNPVDLFKIDMPQHLKEQQLAKAIKQAVRFLEVQGLKVS